MNVSLVRYMLLVENWISQILVDECEWEKLLVENWIPYNRVDECENVECREC